MASNTALGRYFFDRFFSAIELVDFRRLRLLLCDCVDTGIIQITECLNVYLCERFPLPSAGLVLFKYTAANCTAKGTWTNWHLGTSGEQQSIRQPLHDGQCLEVPWASWASWSPWAWQWLLVTSGDFCRTCTWSRGDPSECYSHLLYATRTVGLTVGRELVTWIS